MTMNCRLFLPLILSFFVALTILSANNLRIPEITITKSDTSSLNKAVAKDSYRNRNTSIARGVDITGDSTSVFNCDGKYGQCEYFYPTAFFHPEFGIGRKFRYILETIEDIRDRNELWLYMPRIGFPTFSFNERLTNQITQQPFYRHNVTFIHVHKAGGTTIHSYASAAPRNGVRVTRHYLYHWETARQLTNARTEAELERTIEVQKEKCKLAYYHLGTAGKYKAHPEDWGPDDHVMFAFLRDPLDRFISSLGQAMGASGSERNHVGREFQAKCIKGATYTLQNSRDTLQCCIDYVKEEGFYFEVHFTPQAVEVGFATQMYHVPVAVFKFEDSYQTVLTEIGADPNMKRRGGDMRGYRPSPVLTNMTSADYTPELIRQICELYEVDVIMHRSLGWDVPRCNGYV